MKIEKKQIAGCVAVIDADKLPARATSVGGASYAVGSEIELDSVVEMLPIEGSTSTRNWFGVASRVNGAISVVGFNTLLGVYFDEKKQKQTIVNGVNTLPISKMLGKTLKVVKHEEFNTLRFGTDEVITRTLPVFEIVTAKEAKAPKAKTEEK